MSKYKPFICGCCSRRVHQKGAISPFDGQEKQVKVCRACTLKLKETSCTVSEFQALHTKAQFQNNEDFEEFIDGLRNAIDRLTIDPHNRNNALMMLASAKEFLLKGDLRGRRVLKNLFKFLARNI